MGKGKWVPPVDRKPEDAPAVPDKPKPETKKRAGDTFPMKASTND